MASSRKSSSSGRKTAKDKAENSKIEDAVVVDDTATNEDANAGDAKRDADADETPVIAGETAPVEERPGGDVPTANASSDETVTADATVDETGTGSVGADDTVTADATSDTSKADDTPTASEAANTSDTAEADTVNERALQPVPVAPPAPEKRSTFLPLVLGGVLAGALGFFAAQPGIFSAVDDTDPTAELRSDLGAQQERIAALETAEPAPAVDLAPLEMALSDLDARLTALEERPVIAAPEGVDAAAIGEAAAASAAAAYSTELETLRSSVETQRSEIETLIANARSVEEATADAAVRAAGQAAIAKIVSAIDTGRPFADAVAELTATGAIEVDPALSDVAENGVSSLSALQSEFPDQARTALAAARASGAADGQEGIGGFLTRSLGARSVAPREGNDPDAILSRAEAAIKSGDLETTLTELDALPEDAQAAIADWRAAADARGAARAAADALAQRLTAD